jgi:Legionella pneumophila major outer membrane protein precursor
LPVAVPIDAPTAPMCPPAPEAPNDWLLSGLFVDGDYLYQQAHRNTLDFAVTSPNTQLLPGGVIDSLNYQASSGFRFGAGYELPGQNWAVGVHYSYLHNTDAAQVNAPDNGALYATLTRAGTFDQVESAFATTSLNYNVVDIEASTHLSVNPTLDVNVFGGVRLAWIDQTFGATYNGGPSGAVNATVDSPVYFFGAGLTCAAEAEWKIYRGFGIYGRARVSLLSGQFRDSFTETNNGGQTPITNVSETYRQLVPVVELGAGVSFQTEHFRVRVGYDLANWFNMVNSLDFPSGTDIGQVERRTSDLMLEGLSAQVGVVF